MNEHSGRALDEDVPDEASGGGQDKELQPRPNVQEGLENDETPDSGGGEESD